MASLCLLIHRLVIAFWPNGKLTSFSGGGHLFLKHLELLGRLQEMLQT